MANQPSSIENSVIPTTWNDEDTEYVAQYQIHKQLALKDVDELEVVA